MAAQFKVVSARELQDRFNASAYPAAIESGELVEDVIWRGEPGPCAPRLPRGTKSEAVKYWDRGDPPRAKVIVHRYRRPDYSLGASGQLDPKWMYEDGVIYKAEGKPRSQRAGKRSGGSRQGKRSRRRR